MTRLSGPSFGNPFQQVEMSCQVEVAGEVIRVRQVLPEQAYQDRALREAVETALRQRLMIAVLEKWTPVIKVRR